VNSPRIRMTVLVYRSPQCVDGYVALAGGAMSRLGGAGERQFVTSGVLDPGPCRCRVRSLACSEVLLPRRPARSRLSRICSARVKSLAIMAPATVPASVAVLPRLGTVLGTVGG
jgi:hypothetical protein